MDDDWGVPPFMETPIWIHLVSVSFCVGKSEHLGRRHAGRNICRCVWIIPYSGKWQHDLPIPEVSHLQSTVSRTFSSCVDFFLRRRFPCHFNFYHHPPYFLTKNGLLCFFPFLDQQMEQQSPNMSKCLIFGARNDAPSVAAEKLVVSGRWMERGEERGLRSPRLLPAVPKPRWL